MTVSSEGHKLAKDFSELSLTERKSGGYSSRPLPLNLDYPWLCEELGFMDQHE